MFMREECEDAVGVIKNLGADCAEVFLGTFYEYRPEFAAAYAPRAEGLEIYSVHSLPFNFEPQLFSDSRRVRGDGFYWLDQLMRSAQIFGAKKYTFHGYISGAAGKPDYGKAAGFLNAAAGFTARYGVDLCLENVCWCMYDRPGVFKELKSRCPGLCGVLDIKQARRSGYPANMYIEDMRGSISHAHLSDVDENGKMRLPGKGVYDFVGLFKRLKDAGFAGPCIIEAYGGDYGGYSELKQSVEYLKEIAYKIF